MREEEFRKDCHGISAVSTPRIERCPMPGLLVEIKATAVL